MHEHSPSVALLRTIEVAKLPVGAALLSSQLGIPQATIGRQLLQLEEEGYVEKISNKGRVLSDKGRAFLRAHALSEKKKVIADELVRISSASSRDTLLEIVCVREMLESHTARNAALLADPDTITDLESLAFAHRYNLSLGLPGEREDLGFHLQIASIAGNETIYKMLELLLTNNNAYVEFSKAGYRKTDQQVEFHFRILGAIKQGDAEAAAKAMQEHLRQVALDVEKYYLEE